MRSTRLGFKVPSTTGLRQLPAARRLSVMLAVIAGILLVSLPASAGAAVSTTVPAANPDLALKCGLNVMVVLDESGSIDSTEAGNVRNAAWAFISSISGTGSQVAITEFNTKARKIYGYTGVTAANTGTDTSNTNNIFRRYLYDTPDGAGATPGNGYDPSEYTGNDQYTNWDDAMQEVQQANAGTNAWVGNTTKADLVVFITDGDPTAYNNAAHPPTTESDATAVLTSQPSTDEALDYAIQHANAVKAQGSHIFAVGVGSNLTSDSNSVARLAKISGPDQYPSPQPDFDKGDYTLVTNFTDLEAALKNIATALCKSSVTITKEVDESTGQGYLPASGWTFGGVVSTTALTLDWIQPLPTASGLPSPSSRSVTTAGDGTAAFQWKPSSSSATSSITITESQKPGYAVTGVACNKNNTTVAGLPVAETFTLSGLATTDIVTCTVRNKRTTGKLEVRKTLVGGGTDTFNLSATSPGATSLSASGVGNNGTTGASGTTVPTGTWTPGETAVSPASLTNYDTSLKCYARADGTKANIATGTTLGSTVSVGTNADVVCEITNTKKGSIQLVKDFTGQFDSADRVSLTTTVGGVPATAVNIGDNGSTSARTVAGGAVVTFGEAFTTGSASNYTSTAACVDTKGTAGTGDDTSVALSTPFSSLSGGVTVSAGATVVCTITNARNTGKLEVIKKLNGGGSDTFNLSATGPAGSTALSASGVGNNGTTGASGTTVPTGTWTPGETAVSPASLSTYDTSLKCYARADGTKANIATGTTVGSTVSVASGADVVCEITNTKKATLSVRKVTVPDADPTAFSFALTKGGNSVGGGFPQTRADNQNAVGTTVAADGSSYVFTETTDPGYDLTSVQCFNDNGDTNYTNDGAALAISPVGNAITVTPTAGQQIRCDFTNTKKASIQLVKDFTGDFSPGDRVSLTTTVGGVPATATNIADNGSTAVRTVAGGAVVTFGEAFTTGSASNYTSSAACIDTKGTAGTGDDANVALSTPFSSLSGGVTVPAGATVVCTITNARNTGKLEVIKKLNGGGSDTFDIGANGPAGSTPISAAGVGNNGTTGAGGTTVATGLWILDETAVSPANLALYITTTKCYARADGTKTNIATGVSVVVASGADVVCEITNTKKGSIQLVKDFTGQFDSSDRVTLTTTVGGVPVDTPNIGDNGSTTARLLPADTVVTFGEAFTTGSASNYTSSAACVDTKGTAGTGDDASVALSTPFSNLSGAVTLPAGSTVVCTITNARRTGKLELVKKLVGGGSDKFNLSAGGPSGASQLTASNVGNGGTSGAGGTSVPTGLWGINETAVSPASLTDYTTSLTCYARGDANKTNIASGTTLTSKVTVGSGDDIVCEITNTKDAKLTIAKDAQPDDAQDFAFTASGSGTSNFSLDDDTDGTLINGKAFTFPAANFGTKLITENATAGWDLSSISCPTGDVAFGVIVAGQFQNGATGTAFGAGDDTVKVTAAAGDDVTCTYVNKRVTVDLSKTAADQTINAGENAVFTITATNSGLPGSGTAKGIVITDDLPGNDGANWSITAPPTGCTITGTAPNQKLECDPVNLAAGEHFSVTVSSPTEDGKCGVYDNTATATGTNTGPIDDANAKITCSQSDVTLSKTAKDTTINAGENAVFTITATNSGLPGTGTAKGIVIKDDLPGNDGADWSITAPPTGCAITGTAPNQKLECDPVDLTAGEHFSVTVSSATAPDACGVYENTAKATGSNTGPIDDANAKITCSQSDVTLSKTAKDTTINAGENAVFTITATNSGLPGTGTAKGIVIKDDLPGNDGADWSITAPPTGCAITGTAPNQKLECDPVDLTAGEHFSVTVSSATAPDACGVYENTAKATGSNTGTITEAGDTVTCRKADVTLSKTAKDKTIDAGDDAVFTITATNSGLPGTGTAKGVVIKDDLPGNDGADWSITAPPTGCAITGTAPNQKLECDPVDLAAGEHFSVTVSSATAPDACGVYENTAKATGSNTGTINDASDTVTCRKADVTLSKTAKDTTINAGEDAVFTITATNSGLPGTGTAKGVVIKDDLPDNDGAAWSITAPPTGCTITNVGGDQKLECDPVDLAAGEHFSVTVSSPTEDGKCGVYDNTATATGSNTGTIGDANAKVTCNQSDVTLSKTAKDTTINAGEDAVFTITATNSGLPGTGTANGVVVKDDLPDNDGATWSITAPPTGCTITNVGGDQKLECDPVDLTAGEHFSVTVTSPTAPDACGVYDNTATATGTNTGAITEAGDTVTCRKADVTLSKTAKDKTIDAGDDAVFTITATNSGLPGTGTAKGVVIKDDLPGNDGADWSITAPPTGCAITGTAPNQKLECDPVDLAAGEHFSVTVSSPTSEGKCGVYDNTAKATGTNTGPIADANAKITCNEPTLSVDKAALAVTVDAGSDVSFDITTSNAGPGTAKGVTLNDPLPENVTWTITDQPAGNPLPCSITTDPDTGKQTLDCSFGDLPAGESRKVTVTAPTSFEECAAYTNTATADATNSVEKTDTDTTTCQKPKVSLLKKAAKATVDAGDPIEFTVTATNSGLPGTGTAKGVVLNDSLPGNDGADWSVVSPQADCTITGAVGSQQLVCDPITLAPGESYDVTVKSATSFDSCGTWENTATFSPAEARPAIQPVVIGNAGSGTSNTATIECQKPKLTVTKTADAATVDAGQEIGFTITTENEGPGTAKGVTLKDELPNGGVTWSITSQPDGDPAPCAITGTGDDQVLDCSFGDMADTATKTVHVKATTSFENCSTYDNTATAGATNHPDASNGDSTRCRQPATVRIDKVVQGEQGSETKFGFTSDLSPNAGDQSTSFQLADVDPQKVYTVRPGTYQVTEDDPRGLGYVLTSASCAPTQQQEIAPRKNTNSPEDRKVAIELAEGADVTCTFVNTKLTSGIEVVKSPENQAVYADGTATYTYKVTNTGSSDLTNVTAIDDKCSPLTRTDAGNNDAENLLEQGETWTYTCSIAASKLFGSTTAPITNTATVSGTDRKETKVQDADTAVTSLLVPGIAIDKTGPANAKAGELITYDLAVTNTGNTSFAEASVKLTDTVITGGACATAPTTPKDKKGDSTPSELNPGETWVYQCQVATKTTDTKVTNKGDVSGTDGGGKTVTATDTAETILEAPASNVSPAAAVSGRARMTGTVGCAAAKYSQATVRGSNIKQVTFYVNGKKVKTLTKTNAGTTGYRLRYLTKSLKYGTYKVRAKVQFVTGATPQSRNLDLQFNRCRPRVIKPKFTG